MPRQIRRDAVRQLLDQGARLVEVLPHNEYEDDHLPGAISLPLPRIDSEAATLLDRDGPVIVYCWDTA
jgi:rhodanese-related sulfurtransferase